MEKNKEIFTRPKAKQREHRKCQTKASTSQGNTSNAFEILETETKLEDKTKEQKGTKIIKAQQGFFDYGSTMKHCIIYKLLVGSS